MTLSHDDLADIRLYYPLGGRALGIMETADYFRQKAAQCRRLADGIINRDDPAIANLMTLAVEFEVRAVALAAEQAAEMQIEQTTSGGPAAPPIQTPKPTQRSASRRRARKGKTER
jgi:hypothetical protein